MQEEVNWIQFSNSIKLLLEINLNKNLTMGLMVTVLGGSDSELTLILFIFFLSF